MFRACGSFLDSLFSCGSTMYGKDDQELADEQARLVRDADDTYPKIMELQQYVSKLEAELIDLQYDYEAA